MKVVAMLFAVILAFAWHQMPAWASDQDNAPAQVEQGDQNASQDNEQQMDDPQQAGDEQPMDDGQPMDDSQTDEGHQIDDNGSDAAE